MRKEDTQFYVKTRSIENITVPRLKLISWNEHPQFQTLIGVEGLVFDKKFISIQNMVDDVRCPSTNLHDWEKG